MYVTIRAVEFRRLRVKRPYVFRLDNDSAGFITDDGRDANIRTVASQIVI
jgi:hypothetical protein